MTGQIGLEIEPCPKCGQQGQYVEFLESKWRVIACGCGYQRPGMAVAGVVSQLLTRLESKEIVLQARTEETNRAAEHALELLNEVQKLRDWKLRAINLYPDLERLT